jgi:hypothetical protein
MGPLYSHLFCETWSDTKLDQWTTQITLSEIGIALRPRKSDILRNYKCENPLPLVNSATDTVDQDSPRLNQSPIFILHVSLSSCTILEALSLSSAPSPCLQLQALFVAKIFYLQIPFDSCHSLTHTRPICRHCAAAIPVVAGLTEHQLETPLRLSHSVFRKELRLVGI